MTPLAYDLHIHSCLSPCGDEDMTPGNIVGMSVIKNLNVIALTDHNTCRNCPAFLKIAENFGIIAIPGMELCTREEVHVVCLFPKLSDAMDFDAYVYKHLPDIPNKEAIFGEQLICNEKDEVTGHERKLLINATDISFDEVHEIVTRWNGVMIPAHIDKPSNSLLSNLGFIPPDAKFQVAEIKDLSKRNEIRSKNSYLEHCRIISNSDAHYLEHINEANHFIHVDEASVEGVFRSLLSH